MGEQPIWRYDDEEHAKFAGKHILEMVNFNAGWIGEANYGLAADIEHQRLQFPHRTKGSVHMVEEAAELATGHIYEPWDEIEEQKDEVCKIVVSATKTGVQHFDLPDIPSREQTKISKAQRKDRYSALLLSTYAARTYIEQGQMIFRPFSGGWVDYI